MSDMADVACEREMADRESAVAAASSRAPLLYVGACYNCEAATPPGVRFCDADCRDEWQARRDAEVRRCGGAV